MEPGQEPLSVLGFSRVSDDGVSVLLTNSSARSFGDAEIEMPPSSGAKGDWLCMQTRRFSAFAILFLLLLVAGANAAAATRDFMAHFRYTEPLVAGDKVQVMFVLRLQNHGSQDLTSGTVKFHELNDAVSPQEVFRSVDVTKGGKRILRGYLTVSSQEFAGWKKGAVPRLTLEFKDADGNLQQLPVDLSRMMGPNDEN